ncbi:hypothetical protein [Nocardia abscessus]|uniref:hypothetical protein n=1 Tax=Nocardia abscessus TaxID=120957 RepID=UPI002457028E|nr:hypothetical protein [Nocardia abscessus]
MSNNNRRRRPRPAGAPEPRDHQAPKSPAQREAEGAETVTIKWHGVDVEIPARAELWDPYDVVLPAAAGNIPGAVAALVGPVQLARMKQQYPAATMPDFYELFNLAAEAVGFGGAGN